MTASARLVAFVLLIPMLILPVAPAFASEEVVEKVPTEVPVELLIKETTPEEEPETIPEEPLVMDEGTNEEEPPPSSTPVMPEEEHIAQDGSRENETEAVLFETEPVVILEETASSTEPVPVPLPAQSASSAPAVETEPESSSTPDIALATTTESTAGTTTEMMSDEAASTTNESTSPAPEESGPPEEDSLNQTTEDEEVASSSVTLSPAPPPEPINVVYNNENKFLFSKDECVSVGDGSFYCTAESLPTATERTDGVFAEADRDGDREIFVERDGRKEQITFNNIDDNSPYYDEVSETIVWHRLIDGRYQIMEYDLDRGSEEQLTSERYNNMQPSRGGDVTLWQGWIGNDWEIMLLENDKLTMLTDNNVHDIAPSVNGDYIVWQSFEDDSWKVKVYDINQKTIDTIEDAEGTSLENPRFVLVYDAKSENGDVETKGYDLKSGDVVPLSSQPAPVPEEIPDPDQTGEERALVQTGVQMKTKSESDDDLDLDTSEPQTDNATSTQDIFVPPFESATTTGIADTGTEIDHDSLTIVPLSTDVSEIDDLIIPPLDETTAVSSSDSQD